MKTISSRLSAVAFAIFTTVSQAQIINTFPLWNGSSSAGPFGEPGLATIGQVFTVETGYTQLEGFAFAINYQAGGDVKFAAIVTAWDPLLLRSSGPILYANGPLSLPSGTVGFVPIGFNTGGLSLLAGSQYVAFLTTSFSFDGVGDAAGIAYLGADVYAGGGAVAFNNGSDPSLLQSNSWISVSQDLAFAAVFSGPLTAVPEPSTYGLAGAAFWRYSPLAETGKRS